MEQYNNPPTEGTVPVTKPEHVTTRTPTDRQLDALEAKIAEQGHELLKLRRDIGRLRNDLSDVINMIRTRG